MRYKIVAWHEYQHYKDRCPPWIKLHHSLLTSKIWVKGNDASRVLAIASMLVAARDRANDGSFDGDLEYIQKFAYLNSKPDYKQLIEYDFVEVVQDASIPLAECNTEKEAYKEEKETEKREIKSKSSPLSLLASLGIIDQLAEDFSKLRATKKAPITKTAMQGIDREAVKAGISFEEAIRVCCERGWAGFKAEWYLTDKASKTKSDVWWSSEASILSKGAEFNLYPKPGESMQNFKGRINQKMENV